MQIEIEEGIVTNDGAEIGAIHDGTCFLKKAVGPTVKGAIKKTAGLDALAFVVGEAPVETKRLGTEYIGPGEEATTDEFSTPTLASLTTSGAASKSPISSMSDDELAEEMKRRGLIQDAAPEAVVAPPVSNGVEPDKPARGIGAVARLHALADQGRIPQPPAKHPAMGDKTPEYVAWFKSYATPEEIDIRYPDNRIVPATAGDFEKAEAKRHAALPGEKKDTDKANDFTDK